MSLDQKYEVCYQAALGLLQDKCYRLSCFIGFFAAEVHGTENPLTKRPLDASVWQESARMQHKNELKSKMRTNQLEDPRTQKMTQVSANVFSHYIFVVN